ncbi:MAG: DUF1570 domain-containing protein [Planctomycetia bacterium]|nr:DUF1570 domain-containing protein [Planctomycetia bacterium]
MTRSMFAWLAFLGVAVGSAQANYFMIKVNMGLRPNVKVENAGGNVEVKPLKETDMGGPEKPLTVVVFVEYTKATPITNFPLPAGVHLTELQHKWGRTYLLTDGQHVQIGPEGKPIVRPTVFQRYETKRKDLNIFKNKSPQNYLDLAEYALTNGLFPQFQADMTDLIKSEPKDGPPAAAVKAYKQVQENLKQSLSRDDVGIDWKDQVSGKVDRSEHYALIYDSKSPAANIEARNRLNRLERNLETFYYWWALKGKALPAPDRRLVAVLIEEPANFKINHRAFDSVPLVADGFYARRDNLVVLSTNRVDGPSDPVYRRITELIQGGWDLKNIMSPKWTLPRTMKASPIEIAYAQTMALVKKCLDEESEIATTSHQGSRQLLAALGMLPRGVEMPEWIQFGWPAFFETPKFDPLIHTGAFWPTTGAPSWTYLVQWKVWEQEKQLEEPEKAIRNVLQDTYFDRAKAENDDVLLLKARTMAWSFTYYLMERQLDGLLRYGEELAKLPRDLEFDGDIHLACFARAFNMARPDGTLDDAKLDALAREWYKFIAITPVQMPELLQEASRQLRDRKDRPR